MKIEHRDSRASIGIDVRQAYEFLSQGEAGGVSIPDFVRSLRGPVNESRQRAVTQALQALDEDGTGFIEADEIRRRMGASR